MTIFLKLTVGKNCECQPPTVPWMLLLKSKDYEIKYGEKKQDQKTLPSMIYL